jgi:quercetin dioxygenase-like cupin family protein
MSGPVVRSPLDLRWESVFEGAEMAALYGDPTEPGALFIVRFRTDRLIEVPLHWHRTDEHITVLHRPFSVRFADEKYTQLEEESYVLIPAGVQHASRYGPGTVIQVSGVGPLESIYVDPASHPGGYSVAT